MDLDKNPFFPVPLCSWAGKLKQLRGMIVEASSLRRRRLKPLTGTPDCKKWVAVQALNLCYDNWGTILIYIYIYIYIHTHIYAVIMATYINLLNGSPVDLPLLESWQPTSCKGSADRGTQS